MKKLLIGLTAILTALSVLSVTLKWNPSPESDVIGYRIKWSHSTNGPMVGIVDVVGSQTNISLSSTNFVFMKTNYFTITAYNSSGLESDPSTNLVYWIRSNTVPPAMVAGFRIESATP